MSLNMYIGEVQAQTESMNAFCNATIQGMEEVIRSIDSFTGDVMLQGKTYDSAKIFFVQTYRQLAQGIIYLCEELIRQNNAFPADFQAEVANVDVVEQEVIEQIRELERMIAEVEAMSEHMSGMDALLQVYHAMKRQLEDKLERLYQFNASSSDNYSTALQLAANIAKGLAEVQSGKGFSPASGTFHSEKLNMEWAKPIQAITEEKARKADNSIKYGEACGRPELESEEEGFDGKKLSRDITGEMTGEYDVRRAWEGIDPSNGEKLSAWERFTAGGMVVAGVTPVGKLVKAVKAAKMTDKAVEAGKASKPNYVLFNKTHRDSKPKPKGRGPNGGNLQSHHGLQQQWAKENLSQYGYDPKLAPTVTIETGKGLPHTIISNAQNVRRDERLALGKGKWSSTLQDELKNMVFDFEQAGFSKETIKEVLEQQYKMLDKLEVNYERIEIK